MNLPQQLRALWLESGLQPHEFVSHARMASMSPNERLKICYHGTTAENAEKIRKEGFLPWTYFGEHLEDAVEFGGPHIFEVAFPENTTSESGWQFRDPEHVSPTRIVRYYLIIKDPVYENKELGRRIFESHEAS